MFDNQKKYLSEIYDTYFNVLLGLERQPVGIRFIFSEKEFEESTLEPIEGTIPYCTAVRDAMNNKHRKLKWENFACRASAYAVGVEDREKPYYNGIRSSSVGSYASIGVARRMYKNVQYCGHEAYGVEIARLSEFSDRNPSVILLVTEPKTAMRVSQGYAYNRGYINNIRLSGMCAICHELTSYPYETGDINMSLMCSGTRKLAQWKDEELGIGFPFELARDIIDGLVNTINPLERDKAKYEIEKRVKDNNLKDKINIIFGKNYDDNSMRIVSQMTPSKAAIKDTPK